MRLRSASTGASAGAGVAASLAGSSAIFAVRCRAVRLQSTRRRRDPVFIDAALVQSIRPHERRHLVALDEIHAFS